MDRISQNRLNNPNELNLSFECRILELNRSTLMPPQRLQHMSQSHHAKLIVFPPRNCALSILLTQTTPQSTLPLIGTHLHPPLCCL